MASSRISLQTLFVASILGIIGCGHSNDFKGGYVVSSDVVQWGRHRITKADAGSFKVAMVDGELSPWATDANHVYYRNLRVDGADPASFVAFNNQWAKDKQYLLRGAVKNITSFGVFAQPTQASSRVDKLEGFDTETLRITDETLQMTWFADKDHVFIDGEQVEHADPVTYHRDQDTGCWKDKDFVYAMGYQRICDEIDGEVIFADPKSWRQLDGEHLRIRYYVDDRHVWWCSKILRDADPKSFHWIKYLFSTDGNHVWHRDRVIEGADAETFYVQGGKPFDKNGPLQMPNK